MYTGTSSDPSIKLVASRQYQVAARVHFENGDDSAAGNMSILIWTSIRPAHQIFIRRSVHCTRLPTAEQRNARHVSFHQAST